MERDQAEGEGLALLLEDVLSSEPLDSELLLRYAEDPRSLDAAERAQVQALLASSPAAADQVRVLRNFDATSAAEGPSEGASTALGRLFALVQSGWGRIRPLFEHPGGLATAAAAAALAIAAFYGISPFPGGEHDGTAPSGSDRFAGSEPVPETRPLPANPSMQELPPAAPPTEFAVVEPRPAPVLPKRIATAEEPPAPASPDRIAAVEESTPPAKPVAKTNPEASLSPAVEPEIQIAMLDLPSLPAYSAPAGAMGGFGFGRTSSVVRSAGTPLPRLTALVPEHAGRTVQVSPSLYWSLSSPTERPLVVTLLDVERQETILSVTLPGPHAEGVARFDLARHGARLRVGRPYRWFAAILAGDEPGADDSTAGGGILRSLPDKQLEQMLGSAGPTRAAHVYAKYGLWYDALDAASDHIAKAPQDASGQEQRAALLAAVGLD